MTLSRKRAGQRGVKGLAVTLSGRFPYFTVAVLGAVVGLGSLLAFAQSVQDAWSTGQVYLPRISRYRLAAVVEWQKSVVYLGALLLWSVGGALSLSALRVGPRAGYAAACFFFLGSVLFILSWWHVGLVLALIAAAIAFVCIVWRIGPAWFPVALAVLALGGVVYAAAL